MSGWYVSPVGSWWLVVSITAGFLALALLAARDLRHLPRRRRLTLVGLRVLVFLAVVAGMLRPTHIYTEMKRHRATVLVLVDKSRSMSVADEVNGKSRWDRLKEVVEAALPKFRDLNKDFDVRFATFDTATQGVPLADNFDLGASPDGAETAIGSSLAEALRKEAGHRVAAVLLLSDGGQNALEPNDLAPQTAVRQLAELGAPLYTICFGKDSAGQRRDVAVVAIDAPKQVFVKNTITIKTQVRIHGYLQQDIPVEAWFELQKGEPEKLIGTKNVRAVRDGEEISVQFDYVPQVAGEHKVMIRVPPQPEEQDTANNTQSTYVNVSPGGLNVFYVEGEPRVEQRFLRRSLAASPDIKVDFKWIDSRSRDHWPVNMSEPFTPSKYDVYILGDIDSKAFRKQDLESLRLAVERGAGLIMLGGFHSFWAGGYDETPLRDILPIDVDNVHHDRQNFDERIRDDLHIQPVDKNIGIKMLPDKRFGDISVMQLAPGEEANRQAWQKLPGLEGANVFRKLKFAAKPLATTPDGQPLLVAAEPGAGRVLAFAGDSTWHWYMEGFEKEHKRFWRQTILWLAKKDDTDKTGVWVHLPQRQYMPHRPVEFTAGASDPQGQPIKEAEFDANITAPDGAHSRVHMSRIGSQASGVFRDGLKQGEYTIEVNATKDKGLLGKASGRFIIYQQDLEMESPGAQISLMQNLATMTQPNGGASFPPENLGEICDLLKSRTKELEVPTETKTTPWDKPPFFLLIVGLLVVDWYLRKKWGLV